jgi:fructokinase
MDALCGGIEAGGTKFICAVGTGPDDIRAEERIPTTTPAETLEQAIMFFLEQDMEESLEAVGVASFGPLDLDLESTTHGFITTTPKPGWAFADLLGTVRRELGLPTAIDTDVNAAALGEQRWGAARGLDTFIYLTVGTGIGGGGMSSGRLLHGLVHPEMGHIRIPHDLGRDPFPGSCPYHGDCLEGLATGPALEKRWGECAEELPLDHPAWELEAHYLALALVDYICTLSPQRIVMGGGVMEQVQLFPMIRRNVQELLAGYVKAPEILGEINAYIVPPGLGNRSGVLGAIALAQSVIEI